jgi:hypothetical protein
MIVPSSVPAPAGAASLGNTLAEVLTHWRAAAASVAPVRAVIVAGAREFGWRDGYLVRVLSAPQVRGLTDEEECDLHRALLLGHVCIWRQQSMPEDEPRLVVLHSATGQLLCPPAADEQATVAEHALCADETKSKQEASTPRQTSLAVLPQQTVSPERSSPRRRFWLSLLCKLCWWPLFLLCSSGTRDRRKQVH